MPFFTIKRCEGGGGEGARNGFQGSVVKEIERREKEEEERRGNDAEALRNRDCHQSLRCSLFVILRATIG